MALPHMLSNLQVVDFLVQPSLSLLVITGTKEFLTQHGNVCELISIPAGSVPNESPEAAARHKCVFSLTGK